MSYERNRMYPLDDNDVIYLLDRVMQRVRGEAGQEERLINWARSLAERVGLSQDEIEDALTTAPSRFGSTHVAYLP